MGDALNIHQTRSLEDLQDMGQYFRGLLIVMAADNHLHEEEIKRVRSFGLRCGFSPEYIDENILNIRENKYMPSNPPRFHSAETARDFLLEAARVAACDNELHPLEQKWLLEAAVGNGIDEELMRGILNELEEGSP